MSNDNVSESAKYRARFLGAVAETLRTVGIDDDQKIPDLIAGLDDDELKAVYVELRSLYNAVGEEVDWREERDDSFGIDHPTVVPGEVQTRR